MQPLSDEAVLAGVAAGDADAAAVLVRRFQARVYGLARSIVGDVQLAEDVAQEAFVRAWRHAAVVRPLPRAPWPPGSSPSPATWPSTCSAAVGCGPRSPSTATWPGCSPTTGCPTTWPWPRPTPAAW